MKIELISIGSELLAEKVNTNINLLAEKLATIGLAISRQITVGDNPEEIRQVFTESLARAEIVISTGGLGPTFDDYTRGTVAKVLKKKLVFSREVLGAIVRHFAERNIEMPKENEKQAYILDGAEVIPNKIGTAPGQIITVKRVKCKVKSEKLRESSTFHIPPSTVVILLPGPPREMLLMLEEKVIPYLKEKYETGLTRSVTLHICGLPESEIDEKIHPVLEQEKKTEGLKFALIAHPGTVDLRITLSGGDQMLLEQILKKTKNEIYEILGENIYGEDGQTLEKIIAELMLKKRKTLAIAESCTGGLLGHRITNISGSSLYFKQGVVVYSNESKIQVLGVKSETIEKYGAVSQETVLEMARGMKNLARTNCVLAISGIAGPTGGTEEKPVGLVYVAVIIDEKEIVQEYHFLGSRLEIKEKSITTALDFFHRELLK
ncbi:MAG TPA: competence/damage-inducible protein A [Elusimicrobia bacterium]|jgi:nicotinamide-nucleotide amidase|nr:competence/damage-inducible protein A [Elusimicrobiota bacterium]